MTSADWSTVDAYVAHCAKLLALSDWEITVKREPCEDETAYAQNATVAGRRASTITLRKDFRTLDADVQRSTIIHELLHCHGAGIEHFLHSDLKEHPALTQNDHAFIDAVGMRRLEEMVDGIAEAIAPMFPTIRWPKSNKRTGGR